MDKEGIEVPVHEVCEYIMDFENKETKVLRRSRKSAEIS